jgi:nitrate/nitrite-specific signal transduction histidine kinase
VKDPAGDPSAAVARRGREGTTRYLSELQTENEQLRSLLERVRGEQAHLQTELATLFKRSERSREEFVLVEEQNSKLASLFVSSMRLHETTHPPDVIKAIEEIVVNLIGSEEVAVFLAGDDGSLRLEGGTGIDRAALEHVPLGRGIIGRVAATGERYLRGETAWPDTVDEAPLTACVPLVIDGRVIGAVAIFRLLPQKAQLELADHDLLDLLATQAAVALDYTELRAKRTRTHGSRAAT